MENYVQDRLGHGVYGEYAAILSLAFMLSPLLDMGTAQLLTTRVAARPARARWLTRHMYALRWMLLGLYLPVILICGVLLDYSWAQMGLLLALGLLHMGISLLTLGRALIQGQQRFGLDAWSSVADKLLLLPAVGMLAVFGLTLWNFMGAQLVVTYGVALVLVVQGIRGGWRQYLRWPGRKWRVWLLAALPYALLALGYGLHERIGVVYLERVVPAEEVGLFAAAFRWFSAAQMYLWTILPVFYARFAALGAPEARRNLLSSALVVVSLPMGAIAALLCFQGEVLRILFPHSTPEQLARIAQHLQWQSVGLLFNALGTPFSTQLAAEGRTRALNLLLWFATGCNLVLNLWLIPQQGGMGTSQALMASFGLLMAGYIGVTALHSSVTVPWGTLVRTMVVLAFFWGFMAYLSTWTLWVVLPLALVAFVLLVLVFGLQRHIFALLNRNP